MLSSALAAPKGMYASANAAVPARESDRRMDCCITQKLVLINTALPGKSCSVLVRGRFKFWLMDGFSTFLNSTPSNYSKRTNKRKDHGINNLFIPASVNDNHSEKAGSLLHYRPRGILVLANHLALVLKSVQLAVDSKTAPYPI